jgi:hypothetical protein
MEEKAEQLKEKGQINGFKWEKGKKFNSGYVTLYL